MPENAFKILNNSGDKFQRSGALQTRNGAIKTPAFMPVGTRGAVKGLTPEQVKDTGAQIILGNTYHLHLEPGEKTIKNLGGLHKFTNWSGPILTDSGGFQVFSLAKMSKITEKGVIFNDPSNGDKVMLTPEKSVQIQLDLGADIIMAFDDVVGLDKRSIKRTKEAFDRTHRWLDRSIAEFKRLTKNMQSPWDIQEDAEQGDADQLSESYKQYDDRDAELTTKPNGSSKSRVGSSATKQALAANIPRRPLFFGIVQGGLDKDLRKQSLEMVQSADVDGVAIGGLSVGEGTPAMHKMLEFLAPLYDPAKAHYLMGVGEPENMRFAIEHGIDIFDCVLPTRNARHATAWINECTASSCQKPKASAPMKLAPHRGVEPSGTPSTYRTYASVHSSGSPSAANACIRCHSSITDKKIHLTNAKYKEDTSVIDPGCDCYTCQNGYSKGFLRHQFKVGETLAGSLVSIHNIRYLERLCEEYRA